MQDQILRPDEVVLVRDGPVSAPMAGCLDELVEGSPVPVSLVALERNGGLGPALDAGLAVSAHDIVARMDADDVAMPHRFSVQIPLLESGADIVGSGLVEFDKDPTDVLGRRTPPTDPAEILRYARMHDPFNHPTVVYRRQSVRAAGGYGDLPLMEDYWLFARMLANGARAVNVAEPLVYYRVGSGAYKRRGGMALLRSELMLQRRLHAEGFTTRGQYVRNVAVRGGYRLCPTWLRRAVYRKVVANYGERRERAGAEATRASTIGPEVSAPVSRPGAR